MNDKPSYMCPATQEVAQMLFKLADKKGGNGHETISPPANCQTVFFYKDGQLYHWTMPTRESTRSYEIVTTEKMIEYLLSKTTPVPFTHFYVNTPTKEQSRLLFDLVSKSKKGRVLNCKKYYPDSSSFGFYDSGLVNQLDGQAENYDRLKTVSFEEALERLLREGTE